MIDLPIQDRAKLASSIKMYYKTAKNELSVHLSKCMKNETKLQVKSFFEDQISIHKNAVL